MKKRTGIILLGVGILLLFMFWNPEHKVSDYPTGTGPIVAFGDSLTEGVGATHGSTYVDVLSDRVGEEIVNLGVAGNTTTDGLLRIRELVEYEPRLVILLLGGNDTLRRMSPELTEQNLRDLIETLHDEGSAVLLVGVSGGFSNATRYAEMYEKLAEEYGLAFVPNILKGLLGRSEFMSDTIHPNDAGYVKMADRIEPELRKLLEKQ